jgi:hypothetical protein
MVHRIQEYKPTLKKSGGAVDTSDTKPALAYDSNSDIIMFAEESWFSIIGAWLKTGFLFIVSAVLIFTVLYVTLAVSLVFVTVINDKANIITRGTFLGGEPGVSEQILVSASKVEADDPLSRLSDAFLGIPDAQIGTVVSGPLDTITSGNGTVTVRGEGEAAYPGDILNAKGEVVQMNNQKLEGQFLVSCDSGACTPGSFMLVDDDRIFGEVQQLGKGE